MGVQRRIWLLFFLLPVATGLAYSNSAFDLDGPQIHVNVTRGAVVLPIAEVPNLQPEDQIWLRPELLPGQSIRYLMIVAFLRGSTNPPPVKWFTKAETWNKSVLNKGIRVTVPQGAEHVLLLLAPETGGGFSTVRAAVESEPGVFVRAAVDLNQASLDRSRVETFLSAVRQIAATDPSRLEARSKLLARSLNVKIDIACFDKPVEEQPTCLTKNSTGLVLGNGNTQSTVAALTSGTTSDLFNQISSSPAAGGGMYSPYVGAIVDVVHLLGGMHTADYQYIPALSLENQDLIRLKLNSPPSFRKPKSVLVMGMPAVQAVQFPLLHAVNAEQVYCLQSPKLVLPVEGAPLVFSSNYAREMKLQIVRKTGEPVELTVTPDAERGGYVLDASTENATNLALLEPGPEVNGSGQLQGALQGFWGFDALHGPAFHLQRARAARWTPVTEHGNVLSADVLIVGGKDTFDVRSNVAACAQQVTIEDAQQKALPVTWKRVKPDTLQVQVSMEDATPGPMTMAVQQYGVDKPDTTQLRAYAEAATLEGFVLHSGDTSAVLQGTLLDQVTGAELQGIHLVPSGLTHKGKVDVLQLALPVATEKSVVQKTAKKSAGNAAAETAKLAALQPDNAMTLHVTLKDGRVLDLPIVIQSARPRVALISKTVQRVPPTEPSSVPSAAQTSMEMFNRDDLPQNGRLSFFLKSVVPPSFSRTESIEVAAVDGSFSTMLSVTNGALTLQDAQTVLADLYPAKSFGSSAFGALQFRPVDLNGLVGDWQPLANLVRLPTLQQVRCPMEAGQLCTLSGDDLFLLDAVASDPQFHHAISVPIGFAGSELRVPRPEGAELYIKLRDDPKAVNVIALPVVPELP